MFSGSGRFITPNQIRVTIGEHDLTKEESPRSLEMDIRSISMHPEYRCESVKHDLAILEIAGTLEWSTAVQPVCLPSGIGESDYNRFDDNLATVAGWGWLNEDRKKGKKLFKIQNESTFFEATSWPQLINSEQN